MTIYPFEEMKKFNEIEVDSEYECCVEGCPPTTKINGYEVSIVLSDSDKNVPHAHRLRAKDKVLVRVLSVSERNKSAVAHYVRKL
ncbi:MAG: hypothetical protein V1818_01775 [Candidatus Aenigmatarchaeota archaeon]